MTPYLSPTLQNDPAVGDSARWWALLDSNQQPIGYEPTALTIELRAPAAESPCKPIESSDPCNP